MTTFRSHVGYVSPTFPESEFSWSLNPSCCHYFQPDSAQKWHQLLAPLCLLLFSSALHDGLLTVTQTCYTGLSFCVFFLLVPPPLVIVVFQPSQDGIPGNAWTYRPWGRENDWQSKPTPMYVLTRCNTPYTFVEHFQPVTHDTSISLAQGSGDEAQTKAPNVDTADIFGKMHNNTTPLTGTREDILLSLCKWASLRSFHTKEALCENGYCKWAAGRSAREHKKEEILTVSVFAWFLSSYSCSFWCTSCLYCLLWRWRKLWLYLLLLSWVYCISLSVIRLKGA